MAQEDLVDVVRWGSCVTWFVSIQKDFLMGSNIALCKLVVSHSALATRLWMQKSSGRLNQQAPSGLFKRLAPHRGLSATAEVEPAFQA
jgi:hypothetical protein